MDSNTLALIIPAIQLQQIRCLDLTGGAPELHPDFRNLVRGVRQLEVEVIDRCNLTILSEPGQEDLASFLADEGVTIVASLPCYEMEAVDQQRGNGVHACSIAGLKQLNKLGYGLQGTGLVLNLVHNPAGASLPQPQLQLEKMYRQELQQRYGIYFNKLFTVTNMPIQRFARQLERLGMLEWYQSLLKDSHSDANLAAVMCKSLLSVDWRGYLFDCDFNQQLGLSRHGNIRHLKDLLLKPGIASLEGESIQVGEHCFGCTAGHGSSCLGALN
ncbi:hypothetical protein OMCYN_01489 [cyanobiont of Ornithocercus magnificus]|nr:hypothetical protein OMCYN_01489 [cyanobiont of Ornithocercus magnificus]